MATLPWWIELAVVLFLRAVMAVGIIAAGIVVFFGLVWAWLELNSLAVTRGWKE